MYERTLTKPSQSKIFILSLYATIAMFGCNIIQTFYYEVFIQKIQDDFFDEYQNLS